MASNTKRSNQEQLERLEHSMAARARGREKRKQARDDGQEEKTGRKKGRGGRKGEEQVPLATTQHVPYAETAAADRASRAEGALASELADAVLGRDPAAVRETLARAKAAGVSGSVIEAAEVLLLESQMRAPATAPKAAPRAKPTAMRCDACGIMFFSPAALSEHVCLAAALGEEEEDLDGGGAAHEAESQEERSAAHATEAIARNESSSGVCVDQAAPEKAESEAREEKPASPGGGAANGTDNNALGLLANYDSSDDSD